MNWELVLALVMVVGQGVIAWALVSVVRSFGQYTEALTASYKSNLLATNASAAMLGELRQIRDEMALDRTLAIDRAATFVHDERRETA